MRDASNHSLNEDAPLTRRALPVCAVRFAADRMILMDKAGTMISGSEGTRGLASKAVGGDSRDDDLVLHPDKDDGPNWGFANVHADSHVDVLASLYPNVMVIREILRFSKFYGDEGCQRIFQFGFAEPKHYHRRLLCRGCQGCATGLYDIVEQSAAALLASCTLKNIDMFHKRDELPSTIERLNTAFAAVCEQASVNQLCNLSLELLETHLLSWTLKRGQFVSRKGH